MSPRRPALFHVCACYDVQHTVKSIYVHKIIYLDIILILYIDIAWCRMTCSDTFWYIMRYHGFNDVICKYGSYKYAMNDWPSPTCCQVNQAPTTPEIVSCPHPPWNLIKTHHTFWYGYGSIPINTIFSGMNIHLPAILMFTRGTRFWHTAISICDFPCLLMDVCHHIHHICSRNTSQHIYETHDFRNLLRWAAEIWWNLPISKTAMESHESFSRRSKATPKRCREMAVRCDWHIASPCFKHFFFYMGSTRLVSTSGRQIFWDFGQFWYNFSPCSTRRGVHFEEEKPEKPPERRGKLVTDPSSTMGYTDYTDPPIPPKRLFWWRNWW